MRIICNTPDLLIVRDRSVFGTLAVLTIGFVFAGLGSGAAVYGDDQTTRLAGTAFAGISVLIFAFAVAIARESLHVFDRRGGMLHRRVRSLIAPKEERAIPLSRVLGAEIAVNREIADPDTFRIDLLVLPEHGGDPKLLPLRDYMSSDDPTAVHAELERWLAVRT